MQVNGYRLRQIRIPPELYAQIRQESNLHHQTLTEFYEDVMAWFLERDHKGLGPKLYRASCKNGYRLSLWLRQEQVTVIQKIARQAQVSDARVVYTALVWYIENQSTRFPPPPARG